MHEKLFIILVFSLLAGCPQATSVPRELILQKIEVGPSKWAQKSIDESLTPFRNQTFSRKRLDEIFNEFGAQLQLVKITITDNKLTIDRRFATSNGDGPDIIQYKQTKIDIIMKMLDSLIKIIGLPNLTFFLHNDDGLAILSSSSIGKSSPLFSTTSHKQGTVWLTSVENGATFPMFMLSKEIHTIGILAPDWAAVSGQYQVIKNKDITQDVNRWNTKKSLLVWRGVTGQTSYDLSTNTIRDNNLHLFSRVDLCRLSNSYPNLIDAKFTSLNQGAENVPQLKSCIGSYMTFEDQIRYKYQLLIDGNVSSYSNSGWRFFSNSVVFKPGSNWTQWYYPALEPFTHYIPVKMNLEDLKEKIEWVHAHDAEAEKIAANARTFALENLTIADHYAYWYFLLNAYSHLNFVE